VNRARRFTLLGIAVVVVLFAVTWFSLPANEYGSVHPPASAFVRGLEYPAVAPGTVVAEGSRPGGGRILTETTGHPAGVHLDQLKTRIVIFYGSLAAVIVLVGLAFGAGRRSSSAA
jgi:hypothetical protein